MSGSMHRSFFAQSPRCGHRPTRGPEPTEFSLRYPRRRDAEVEAFRSRSLGDEPYPYLWLDATYVKVREAGRVVSMAALVATGVAGSGERRILGLELAAGNDEGSAWPAFIGALVERGLSGVRLVISDDHRGLVKAVREQLLGAAYGEAYVRRFRVRTPRRASVGYSVFNAINRQPRVPHDSSGSSRARHNHFGQRERQAMGACGRRRLPRTCLRGARPGRRPGSNARPPRSSPGARPRPSRACPPIRKLGSMRDDELRPNPDAVAGAPLPMIGLHRLNGTTLYAEVRGSGPAVLLIPGGAEDAEGWRAVAERLPRRTVVTYDRRGTLRSGREDWPGRGSAQHADDAAALIHELGLGDVVVFGGSSAGVIAVQLAIRHPELVRRALVYEPGYLRATQRTLNIRSLVLAAMEAHLRIHPGDWRGAHRAFARVIGPTTGSVTPPSGRDWYGQREELNAEAMARDDIPILTAEALDEASLAPTPVDVRFSYGGETDAIFRDIAVRLAAVRGGVPEVIDGAGHGVYLHPDAAAAYLGSSSTRWVSRQARAPRDPPSAI
jgi:pimeloyl-ACP methyl ester carboxylesterase